MSDVEMEYDDEEYNLEYESNNGDEQDQEADIENQYYTAKGDIDEKPDSSLKGFQQVLALESEKGKWGFKALKQICKIQFTLGQDEAMLRSYEQMLEYVRGSAVTRNAIEKTINKLLDFVSTSSRTEFLERFYEKTLVILSETKNDRLWFSTTIKLCRACFDGRDYPKMQKILKDLHKSCQLQDGQEDSKKSTQLQEIYALEIQLCMELKNHKRLKELYGRSMQIKAAIPHPRILAVIRECGGKMHMAERDWDKAHTDFFEAFKNYDEAGHPRRIQCLKYLVLANMLAVRKINPFDSPEAKPYKENSDIVAMTNLLSSYEANQIKEFERILQANRASIMDDPFIRLYIEDLLRTIRTQVLLSLIKPYTRITIQYISQELNIPKEDVEALLVALILDHRVEGRIDQLSQILELRTSGKGDARYAALNKWDRELHHLYDTVAGKIKSSFL